METPQVKEALGRKKIENYKKKRRKKGERKAEKPQLKMEWNGKVFEFHGNIECYFLSGDIRPTYCASPSEPGPRNQLPVMAALGQGIYISPIYIYLS